jgi:hypothetical protein
MTPDEIMKQLDECGWFEGRTEGYREEKKNALADAEGELDAEAVATALADFIFDTECIDGNEGDYANVVKLFADAAQDFFLIEDIEDRFVAQGDSGAAAVMFRVGDEPYMVSVPFESDWFDEGVANLLNTAAQAHGQGRMFELLPVLDQCAYVAFVKPAALKAAADKGLLVQDFEALAEG